MIRVQPVEAPAETQVVTRTVTNIREFAELEPGWDDLVRAMRRPSPFFLHAWLRQWCLIERPNAELAVQVAYRDGRLVGALPFVMHPRFGVKVAEFIGGNCSPLGDVLVAPDEPEETARMLVDRARVGGQHLVDLFGLPGQSLLSKLVAPGDLRLIRRVDAPVLDLSSGWDDVYKSKTSSKTRNLHKRRRRQLSELGKLEVEVARTADELDAAIEDAFKLHELRWAGRPDGSNFGTPHGRRFHRAAVRELAAFDLPRIVLLKLDGRAIAFHYYLAFSGRMFVHRLAFDPALGRYSPGLINTLDAIQAAAEEGVTYVEYLGGGERYKADLADGPDPLYQGIGMTTNAIGRAVASGHERVIETRKRMRNSKTLRTFYFEGLAPARRLAARVRRRGKDG
jgi:CelD/BcsL family acetyltransferase involved in cellulose biosynthesis